MLLSAFAWAVVMWWLVIVRCFVEALWQGVLYYLFFEERLYAFEEVEVFWC